MGTSPGSAWDPASFLLPQGEMPPPSAQGFLCDLEVRPTRDVGAVFTSPLALLG